MKVVWDYWCGAPYE